MMRRSLFQNLLWALPAETAHSLRMWLMRAAGRMPLGRWMMKMTLAPRKVNLEREVFGVHFKNPIGIAAGFDPDGRSLDELGAAGFGFVEIGSITPQSQPGTPRPRLTRLRTTDSLIDNSGYPNRGLEFALKRVRKRSKHTANLVVGCNIGRTTASHIEDVAKEYLRVFRNMYQYVDFFVINIACNTSSKPFVPRSREEILSIVEPLFEFRRGQPDYRPILLKISPDLSYAEIDQVVDILIETPLDGIEAVAGSYDMAPNSSGAVSGAMLADRAIEVVRYVAERSLHNYPIIGTGGVMQPEDVKRMLEAGASLVALNTGIRENGFRLLRHAARAIAPKPEPTPAPEAVATAEDK